MMQQWMGDRTKFDFDMGLSGGSFSGWLYCQFLFSTFIQRHFSEQNLYKDFLLFFTKTQLMESIPGLKKCFNFVAELSKKILATVPIQSLTPTVEKVNSKSLSNSENKEQLSIKPILSSNNPQKPIQHPSPDKPKIICFQSYMNGKQNALKNSTIRLLASNRKSFKKQTKQTFHKLKKPQIYQINNHKPINEHSDYMENFSAANNNRKTPNQIQIPSHKIISKTYFPNNQFIKISTKSGEDSGNSNEEVQLGKKDKKIIKKNQKNSVLGQSVQVSSNQIIFTYEDGDDISSIAAKSETTDQIQPELLSFIHRKGNVFFNKLDELKINEVPAFDMKKKPSHHQGETLQTENTKKNEYSTKKVPQNLQNNQLKPKKRAFQLYPGETFEQFKKRVLIQEQQESQSYEDDFFESKVIKKQEYNKLLSHLNKSVGKMEEQKNRQASILVVEKMVDESQNQDLQQNQTLSKYFLNEIENYKVWNNAADNPSLKLYFRDV